VKFVRSGDTELSLRIYNEAKAGQPQSDLFDGIAAVPAMKAQGLTAAGLPDEANALPDRYRDPAGQWVATNLYVLTPGINTNLVPAALEPRTLRDLLDPRWRGKMAWNSDTTVSAGPGLVGLALRSFGEDKGTTYLKQLATQKIANLAVSSRQVLDEVIAGDYAIGLQTFDNHSVISAKLGAPVKWLPMDPSMVVLATAARTSNSPHPNAGKLFLGFLVSLEGQRVFRDADYIPVDPQTPPKVPDLRPDGVHFKAEFFTPDEVHSSLPRWTELYQDLFR
jgi:iron(III) transport system substrate-binding protein